MIERMKTPLAAFGKMQTQRFTKQLFLSAKILPLSLKPSFFNDMTNTFCGFWCSFLKILKHYLQLTRWRFSRTYLKWYQIWKKSTIWLWTKKILFMGRELILFLTLSLNMARPPEKFFDNGNIIKTSFEDFRSNR